MSPSQEPSNDSAVIRIFCRDLSTGAIADETIPALDQHMAGNLHNARLR